MMLRDAFRYKTIERKIVKAYSLLICQTCGEEFENHSLAHEHYKVHVQVPERSDGFWYFTSEDQAECYLSGGWSEPLVWVGPGWYGSAVHEGQDIDGDPTRPVVRVERIAQEAAEKIADCTALVERIVALPLRSEEQRGAS